MSEDQFTKLFKYMEKRFDNLEQEMDKRFDEVNARIDRLTDTIDAFVKRLDDYDAEMAARDAQWERLLEWAREVSKKTGVPLKDL